jgi:1-acyl-sn-glycerol-3-phosphate acyltransferase
MCVFHFLHPLILVAEPIFINLVKTKIVTSNRAPFTVWLTFWLTSATTVPPDNPHVLCPNHNSTMTTLLLYAAAAEVKP